MTKKQAALFVTGYLRGLWSKYDMAPEPIVIEALKALGIKQEHLPAMVGDDGKTKEETHPG